MRRLLGLGRKDPLEKFRSRDGSVLLVDKVLEIGEAVRRVDAEVNHFVLLPNLLRREKSRRVGLVILSLDLFKKVGLSLTGLSWCLVIQAVDFDPCSAQYREDSILVHDLVIYNPLAGEHQVFENVEHAPKERELHHVKENG